MHITNGKLTVPAPLDPWDAETLACATPLELEGRSNELAVDVAVLVAAAEAGAEVIVPLSLVSFDTTVLDTATGAVVVMPVVPLSLPPAEVIVPLTMIALSLKSEVDSNVMLALSPVVALVAAAVVEVLVSCCGSGRTK